MDDRGPSGPRDDTGREKPVDRRRWYDTKYGKVPRWSSAVIVVLGASLASLSGLAEHVECSHLIPF